MNLQLDLYMRMYRCKLGGEASYPSTKDRYSPCHKPKVELEGGKLKRPSQPMHTFLDNLQVQSALGSFAVGPESTQNMQRRQKKRERREQFDI